MWDPEVCSTVCRATAERADREGVCLHALASRFLVLYASDGVQHVLLKNSGRQLQLAVDGSDIACPVRLATTIPRIGQGATAHLWMTKCLSDLCSKGTLPNVPHSIRRCRRLRFVLQALDGSLAHASHREISCALFGENRTAAGWSAPSEYLRHTVMRAVRRGKLLMNGGYKTLLSQL
jgi:hypothetical protein